MIPASQMGGAESMLLRIAEQAQAAGVKQHVVVLMESGPLTRKLEQLSIPATAVNGRRSLAGIASVAVSLRTILGQLQPDVVQTWMYAADVAGSLAWLMGARMPLVWNIRHSTLDTDQDSRSTRWSAAVLARLSPYVPSCVLCNSRRGWTNHQRAGYRPRRHRVIPNGFCLERFAPRPDCRRSVRRLLGLDADCPLIGMVGRNHPLKNPLGFVELAGRVARREPRVHFVMVGRGLTETDGQLSAALARWGLAGRVHRVGVQEDVPRWLAALDGLVLPSHSEGFPNVVGEAMACGVPCVATAVGAVPEIVGRTGWIVDRADPEMLAGCVVELLGMDAQARAARTAACRQRIAQHYDIRRIAGEYVDVWREVAASGPARRSGDPASSRRPALLRRRP